MSETPIKVLVVDDDDDSREVLRQHIVRRGYEVETARDGIAALRVVQEARTTGREVTHCILDCAMPLMDGVTCAETLRLLEKRNLHYSRLRIAFFSAYLDGIPCAEIMERGDADLCLEKGSRTTESIDRILTWIKQAE
jgi:CheY-like chemotaxis protein